MELDRRLACHVYVGDNNSLLPSSACCMPTLHQATPSVSNMELRDQRVATFRGIVYSLTGITAHSVARDINATCALYGASERGVRRVQSPWE